MDINDLDPKAWKGHTNGPWLYHEDKGGAPNRCIFATNKPKKAQHEYGAVVAEVSIMDPVTGLLSKKEYGPNARLIADAPYLPLLVAEIERLREKNEMLQIQLEDLRDWDRTR